LSTLLFIHGSGCTSDAFENQMHAFPQAHAPNLPGHASPGQCKSVAEFADFIQGYISHHNLQDVVLCGSSLGGAIALEVALRESPEVRGVILLGSGSRLKVPPAILTGLDEHFELTVERLAGLMFAHATPERAANAVQNMQAVGQAQTLRDYQACNAFDVTQRLPELLLPLLAVTGEHDVMTPPKYAQSLVDRVPAGEVRIIPGAGHLVMIERPAETNDAIADFVNRVK